MSCLQIDLNTLKKTQTIKHNHIKIQPSKAAFLGISSIP